MEPLVESAKPTHQDERRIATNADTVVKQSKSRRRLVAAQRCDTVDGAIAGASSRREWLQMGAAALFGGGVVVTAAAAAMADDRVTVGLMKYPPKPIVTPLAPVNFTKVAKTTSINVTMECTTTCVSVDKATQKIVRTLKVPSWVPSYLVPPPRAIRETSDEELLIASVTAGSLMEMFRTSLIYPLYTLKTRTQAEINNRQSNRRRRLRLKRRLQVAIINARRYFREGNLYAGLAPSLLAAVPATGIYYGVRDVAKRGLLMTPLGAAGLGDIPVAVSAAFFADIASLAVRTPADTLAMRLQTATKEESDDCSIQTETNNLNGRLIPSDEKNYWFMDEVEEDCEDQVDAEVGNWLQDSIARLPTIILTDLPYLLSRISLNRAILHGVVDIGQYEVKAISTALLLGFLTTPFDVARTRILVDIGNDPKAGIGLGGKGLLQSFRAIMKEGDGGVQNLYAGWLERTAYLGFGRAWLEPLSILGFVAVRDTILLEWFN